MQLWTDAGAELNSSLLLPAEPAEGWAVPAMGTVVPMKPPDPGLPEPAVCGDCSLHVQAPFCFQLRGESLATQLGTVARQDVIGESVIGESEFGTVLLEEGWCFGEGLEDASGGNEKIWKAEGKRRKDLGHWHWSQVQLPVLDVFGSRAETLVYSDQIENVISLMFANSHSCVFLWNVNVDLRGLGENQS